MAIYIAILYYLHTYIICSIVAGNRHARLFKELGTWCTRKGRIQRMQNGTTEDAT